LTKRLDIARREADVALRYGASREQWSGGAARGPWPSPVTPPGSTWPRVAGQRAAADFPGTTSWPSTWASGN